MSNVIQKFDLLEKKGFDNCTIYRLLEEDDSVNDHSSDGFYEYIAFLLAEYLPDRQPWGCLFGYRCAVGMSDGSEIQRPPFEIITSEMVEYWDGRITRAVNPILRQRYSALVLEFKKRVCGIKPDYKFRRLNVELIKTLIDEEYITDEMQIATKLHYAFGLLPSIQDDSLTRNLISVVSAYLAKCPDKGWAVDTCLDILSNKNKLFNKDEHDAWIASTEAKLTLAREQNKVDAWRTLGHVKRLMKFFRQNEEKLLSYIEDVISDFRICCGANEMMLYGNLESVRDLCVKFNLLEKAKSILLEMQRLAKGFDKYMGEYAIPLPYSKKRALKIKGLCLSDIEDESLDNFIACFIPTKDEAKEMIETEKTGSPMMSLLKSQQLDQDYHPLSAIGGADNDEEGKLVEKYKLLVMADEELLHDVIVNNIGRGVFSVESVMEKIHKCVAFKPSRYAIVEKGLKAYFDGDYIVALHLLIPQIENAVRVIFEQNGGLVLKGHNYGLQLDTLDNVLKSEEVKLCFTDNGAFYLKNLFSDMRSCNWRNNICHGLMEESEMGYAVADRVFHALIFVCKTKMKPVS